VVYQVQIDRGVIDYLNGCERLTDEDRGRIIDGLLDELGESADKFLERNPHPFHVNCFWYDYILMTAAHEVREFRFACNAEGHVYGVTQVLYVDEYPVETE